MYDSGNPMTRAVLSIPASPAAIRALSNTIPYFLSVIVALNRWVDGEGRVRVIACQCRGPGVIAKPSKDTSSSMPVRVCALAHRSRHDVTLQGNCCQREVAHSFRH